VGSGGDEPEHGSRARNVVEIVSEQTVWLLVQNAERVERQIAESPPGSLGKGPSELPVTRHATEARPCGYDFARRLGSRAAPNPANAERSHSQDLSSATEEWRRRIQHESVHHSLRRPEEHEMSSCAVLSVDEFLEQARKFGRAGNDRGQFVEREHHALRSFPSEPIQQRLPTPVCDIRKPRQKSRDFRCQRRALNGTVPVVSHVVDRGMSSQRLSNQSRLPDAPPAIDDGERPFTSRQGALEPGELEGSVQERRGQANNMLPKHNVGNA
jgi:hypothetical protein